MTFLGDLQELVELQSPSEDLAACARVVDLAVAIAARNLQEPARVTEAGGRPVFWWGSDKPEVVLLCHLDTVWPIDSYLPLWRVEGDQIFGPGIFDMKAGFLQAMYAIKEIPNASQKIALVGTTDEEIGSHASRQLIEDLARSAKATLVFESSIDDTVKIGRKGTSMYRITVHGRAAHAGLEPEKGINATTEISKIVLAMAALENSEHGTTVVPTVMQSGSTTNTVPATASLDIDARSFLAAELVRIDEAIKSLKPSHPAGVNMLLTTLTDIPAALKGSDIGTIFAARTDRKPSRLLWLAHASTPHGKLMLDAGATTAIKERGTSLLAAGVNGVEGEFIAGDTVELLSPHREVIARGLVAFDSSEIPAMLGKSTKQLAAEFGPEYERELVHRDDLVLL